jgi:AraC family transcriptional regulator of arabinose operon
MSVMLKMNLPSSHSTDALFQEGRRPRPMDRLCLFPDGFMFSSEGIASTTRRHAATILIALDRAPIEVEVEGHAMRLHALALRPSVAKRLDARHVPFACVDTSVNHPSYRHFRGITDAGCMPLARERLAWLLPAWRDFHDGNSTPEQINHLYRQTVDLIASMLPSPCPLDKRVQQVVAMYGQSPHIDFAHLVSITGLSQGRLSHLFSQQLGISLRTYGLLCKVYEASLYHHSKAPLTHIAQAAGFADSAHFSKVWAQTFGRSPAYFFGSDSVHLYSNSAPSPIQRCASVQDAWHSSSHVHQKSARGAAGHADMGLRHGEAAIPISSP